MTFTVSNIADAIAEYLSPLLPGFSFYEDPNQQGTQCPCAFLQLMTSDVKPQTHGYLLRTLRYDLTVLEDYNLPDLQRRYQDTQEVLDLNMETFPYGDAVLRTYNRQSSIDLDALHYKFDLMIRLSPQEDELFMQSLTLALEVAYGEKY